MEVTVTTPLGSATLPGGFTYTATPPPPPPPVVPPVVPPVDVTAPTAVMARPTAGVTLSSVVPVSWSGRDVGGAVAWYQVQRAVKAPGAALGGYRTGVGRACGDVGDDDRGQARVRVLLPGAGGGHDGQRLGVVGAAVLDDGR